MSFERYEPRYDDEQGGELRATTTCPECDGALRTEGGETTCTECGLVIDEYRYDHGATPRSYRSEEREREQVGAPRTVTRHDHGLSTEIGRRRDATGNRISMRKRRQLGRLRREHSRGRFQSKAERNLAHALTEIKRITGALELGRTIQEVASQLYRQAQDADLIRGRSTEGMAAAAVYAACRTSEQRCTPEELASVVHLDPAKLRDRYTVLNRELELPVPPTHPRDHLPRLASACSIPERARVEATRSLDQLDAADLTVNRKPSGVAAACVFDALERIGRSPTKVRIAEEAGVSVMTLNERLSELRELSSSCS